MRLLVVNAGSSSVKLSLIGEEERTLAERELAAPQATVDPAALQATLAGELAGADVAAHRIVHGGERFRDAVVIDGEVEEELRELVEMAPLHQAKSLGALDVVSNVLPAIPAVACFDTAFHSTLSAAASTYALPAAWRERWPIRRYGFHGLSHAWIARQAPRLLGSAARSSRIVSCHLGAGASVCAISGGRSVDTTMGFTPLEGLVMATRCGSVDPGLLLWLMERTGLPERDLAGALEHESGLLGLAGTADMREALARARAGDHDASSAIDVYIHRLCASVAAMAAALGGLDVLAFTGGVGERSAEIRARAGAGLTFLGVHIDQRHNAAASGTDADVSAATAHVKTVVVRSREDLEMARQARAALDDRESC